MAAPRMARRGHLHGTSASCARRDRSGKSLHGPREASLVAFLLWSYGVSTIGPERAGQFVQLMPVFGAALAVALLGETIVLPQVAGALCVFAGIALVQRRPRPRARPA